MKYKDELLKIIEYYGVLTQLKYFQSEVFELNEAIINYEDEKSLKDLLDIKVIDSDISKKKHITEEIADVLVMLYQFIEYYKIQDSDIYMIIEQKIDRQIERIENEK